MGAQFLLLCGVAVIAGSLYLGTFLLPLWAVLTFHGLAAFLALKCIVRASLFPGSLVLWRLILQGHLRIRLGKCLERDILAVSHFFHTHGSPSANTASASVNEVTKMLFRAGRSFASIERSLQTFQSVMQQAAANQAYRRKHPPSSARHVTRSTTSGLLHSSDGTFASDGPPFLTNNAVVMQTSSPSSEFAAINVEGFPKELQFTAYPRTQLAAARLLLRVACTAVLRVLCPRRRILRAAANLPCADPSRLMCCLQTVFADLQRCSVRLPRCVFQSPDDATSTACCPMLNRQAMTQQTVTASCTQRQNTRFSVPTIEEMRQQQQQQQQLQREPPAFPTPTAAGASCSQPVMSSGASDTSIASPTIPLEPVGSTVPMGASSSLDAASGLVTMPLTDFLRWVGVRCEPSEVPVLPNHRLCSSLTDQEVVQQLELCTMGDFPCCTPSSLALHWTPPQPSPLVGPEPSATPVPHDPPPAPTPTPQQSGGGLVVQQRFGGGVPHEVSMLRDALHAQSLIVSLLATHPAASDDPDATSDSRWLINVASSVIEHPLGSLDYLRVDLLQRYCGFQFWLPVSAGDVMLDAAFLPAKHNRTPERFAALRERFRAAHSWRRMSARRRSSRRDGLLLRGCSRNECGHYDGHVCDGNDEDDEDSVGRDGALDGNRCQRDAHTHDNDVELTQQPQQQHADGWWDRFGGVVLFFNPNAEYFEAAAYHNEFVDFYINHGINVVLFNHRGFGRSESLPSPHSVATDALDVARFLSFGVGVEKLGVHGQSIGGIGAAAIAQSLPRRIRWFCCDRTFGTLSDTAEQLMGRWVSRAVQATTAGAPETNDINFLAAAVTTKVLCWDPNDLTILDAASLRTAMCSRLLRLARAQLLFGQQPTSALMFPRDDYEQRSRRSWSSIGGAPQPSGGAQLPAWLFTQQHLLRLPAGRAVLFPVSSKGSLLAGVMEAGAVATFVRAVRSLQAWRVFRSAANKRSTAWLLAIDILLEETPTLQCDEEELIEAVARRDGILKACVETLNMLRAGDLSLPECVDLRDAEAETLEKIDVLMLTLALWGNQPPSVASIPEAAREWLRNHHGVGMNHHTAKEFLLFLRRSAMAVVRLAVKRLQAIKEEKREAGHGRVLAKLDEVLTSSIDKILLFMQSFDKLLAHCTALAARQGVENAAEPAEAEIFLAGWLVPLRCGHNGHMSAAELTLLGMLLRCSHL